MRNWPRHFLKLVILILALRAFALTVVATDETQTYRQKDNHATNYLELQRVEGGVRIVRLYRMENFMDKHPEPSGTYFLAVSGPERTVFKVTLTNGPVTSSEWLPVTNPRPIADYPR